LISIGTFLDACEAIDLLNIINETKNELKKVEEDLLRKADNKYDTAQSEKIKKILKKEIEAIGLIILKATNSDIYDSMLLTKQLVTTYDYHFIEVFRTDYKSYNRQSTTEWFKASNDRMCSRILENNTPSWILDIAAIKNLVCKEQKKVRVIAYEYIDEDGNRCDWEEDRWTDCDIFLNERIRNHKNATKRTLEIIEGRYKF
jgi:hypothetical protein